MPDCARSVVEIVDFVRSWPGDDESFNPWRDCDLDYDCGPDAAGLRYRNLVGYLEAREGRARILACAEATGYQGGRFTGIPLTSERILAGKSHGIDPTHVLSSGLCPRTSREDMPHHRRISKATRKWGFAEPTATHLWKAIGRAGIDPYAVVLWNLFPLHAHRRGNPLSNRPLRARDIELGSRCVAALLRQLPGVMVVAVGRRAHKTFDSMGQPHAHVRHPSQGGAPQFHREFAKCLQSLAPR